MFFIAIFSHNCFIRSAFSSFDAVPES